MFFFSGQTLGCLSLSLVCGWVDVIFMRPIFVGWQVQGTFWWCRHHRATIFQGRTEKNLAGRVIRNIYDVSNPNDFARTAEGEDYITRAKTAIVVARLPRDRPQGLRKGFFVREKKNVIPAGYLNLVTLRLLLFFLSFFFLQKTLSSYSDSLLLITGPLFPFSHIRLDALYSPVMFSITLRGNRPNRLKILLAAKPLAQMDR